MRLLNSKFRHAKGCVLTNIQMQDKYIICLQVFTDLIALPFIQHIECRRPLKTNQRILRSVYTIWFFHLNFQWIYVFYSTSSKAVSYGQESWHLIQNEFQTHIGWTSVDCTRRHESKTKQAILHKNHLGWFNHCVSN